MSDMTEFEKGIVEGKLRCYEAVEKVAYQSGHQPDRYSEWVWSDRPAYNVKQDCLEAITRVSEKEEGK